jgi:hypothetical protein
MFGSSTARCALAAGDLFQIDAGHLAWADFGDLLEDAKTRSGEVRAHRTREEAQHEGDALGWTHSWDNSTNRF